MWSILPFGQLDYVVDRLRGEFWTSGYAPLSRKRYLRQLSDWTCENTNAHELHGAGILPSRTPSPFFWPHAITGVMPPVDHCSPDDWSHNECHHYDRYDGHRTSLGEGHSTTSAERASCPVCLHPLVRKYQCPCEGCTTQIEEVIRRKEGICGPASNRWVGPDLVSPGHKDLFGKMANIASTNARHTLQSRLWACGEGDLFTRSKEFVKFMNQQSLGIKALVTGFNDKDEVIRPADEKLRMKLSPLIRDLSQQALLSHQRCRFMINA